jgi:hypothetical protein
MLQVEIQYRILKIATPFIDGADILMHQHFSFFANVFWSSQIKKLDKKDIKQDIYSNQLVAEKWGDSIEIRL